MVSSDSQFRQEMNEAILKLKESGAIKEMQKKWWNPKNECDEKDEEDGTQPMGLGNVGGVFIVLIVGIFISLVLGFIEFWWAVRQTSIEYKVSGFILAKNEYCDVQKPMNPN